jgi:hypothetical protein
MALRGIFYEAFGQVHGPFWTLHTLDGFWSICFSDMSIIESS